MRFKQFIENLDGVKINFNSGKKDFEKDLGPDMTSYFNKITGPEAPPHDPNKDLEGFDLRDIDKSKLAKKQGALGAKKQATKLPDDATESPTGSQKKSLKDRMMSYLNSLRGKSSSPHSDPQHILSSEPSHLAGLKTVGAPKGKLTRRESF
jgi:hypothetical protein